MNEHLEYMTVTTTDDESKFINRVNAMLAGGWQLQGGVSVALSESDEYRYIVFAQAMTRVFAEADDKNGE